MSDSENELGIEDFLPGGGSESETEIEEQTSMSTSPDDKSGDEAKPKTTEKVEVEETDKKAKSEDGSSRFRKFIDSISIDWSKPRSLGLSIKQIGLAVLLSIVISSVKFGYNAGLEYFGFQTDQPSNETCLPEPNPILEMIKTNQTLLTCSIDEDPVKSFDPVNIIDQLLDKSHGPEWTSFTLELLKRLEDGNPTIRQKLAVMDLLIKKKINQPPAPKPSIFISVITWFWNILSRFGSIILEVMGLLFAIGLGSKLLGKMSLGVGLGSSFKSSFKPVKPEDLKVKFEDVKGCDEAKEELQNVVEFLKNPKKYADIGALLPKGVLLSGPPGNGKTLLAKAVAGQAEVSFFQTSGSEFDEVFVGLGASKVRNLFKSAKKHSPCVIFIDEIDSVGGKRISSSNHPYANQTINQLLSAMDGFKSSKGIIVLGATNRPDDLDKALLRPGRFDTKVQVNKPDVKGRKEILDLYLKKTKFCPKIDLDVLAKRTVGFSGADLQNLINHAAIEAANKNKEQLTNDEIEYSFDKQVMGVDLKSRVRDPEDLKITAFHEAGHAIVAHYTKGADPIHKVTIIAKGHSGGHTAFVADKDQSNLTKNQVIAKIDVAMGGRVAEEIIFGIDKVTTGASQDLTHATDLAEAMVQQFGMSGKIGLRVYSQKHLREGHLSDSTKAIIDEEITKLLDDSFARAMNVLQSHRSDLDRLAEALLNNETLDKDQVLAILNNLDTNQNESAEEESKEASKEASDGDSNEKTSTSEMKINNEVDEASVHDPKVDNDNKSSKLVNGSEIANDQVSSSGDQ